MNTLMSKRFLSHTFSSKECSLAFMASKAVFNVKSFTHMKTIATTMRTGKSDRGIQPWHLPPPKIIISDYCITLYHFVSSKLYNGIHELFTINISGEILCKTIASLHQQSWLHFWSQLYSLYYGVMTCLTYL